LKEGFKRDFNRSGGAVYLKRTDSAYLLSKLSEAESLASPYKGVSSWQGLGVA